LLLSILVVRALVESVEQAGVRRERFLAAAGKSAAWLEESDTRLSFEEYDRMVELALEITKDPALGLHETLRSALGSVPFFTIASVLRNRFWRDTASVCVR